MSTRYRSASKILSAPGSNARFDLFPPLKSDGQGRLDFLDALHDPFGLGRIFFIKIRVGQLQGQRGLLIFQGGDLLRQLIQLALLLETQLFRLGPGPGRTRP